MAEKKTIQEAVKEILQLRGKDIFKNMKQFWALLDDLAPESQKERKIIKRSLDEELLQVFIDDSKKVNHRIKILQDNFEDLGVKEDCADFIIDSFGIPLGWSQEIREMKLNRQSSSSVASQSSVNGNANYEDIILDEEGLRKLGITDKKSLTTVNIPATFNTYVGTVYRITKIGDQVFKNCDKLETVVIPDTVTEIGNNAFAGCKSLKSVNIPSDVTKIGNGAFNGCSVLEKIVIPNKVAEIGDEAFKDCEILENVILPDSVKKIGNNAFRNCINAFTDNVIIPNSVIDISSNAFLGCYKIEQFTVPVVISKFKIFEEVTLGETVLRQLGYEVNYSRDYYHGIISSSLKKNGQEITSLNIPVMYFFEGTYYKITNIGDEVFKCSSLKSVTIPNSVTQIGNSAFYDCSLLTNVIIPNSVKYIGAYAFHNCKSLKSLTIPDSVTKIGDGAFSECTSLSISIPKNCSYSGSLDSHRNDYSNYSFYKCKEVTRRS